MMAVTGNCDVSGETYFAVAGVASASARASYTEGTLEQFELANKPGALAELAGKLAKKGINIDSAYATMPKGAKKAVVVLGASKASETGGA
jgi:hypothetical protein